MVVDRNTDICFQPDTPDYLAGGHFAKSSWASLIFPFLQGFGDVLDHSTDSKRSADFGPLLWARSGLRRDHGSGVRCGGQVSTGCEGQAALNIKRSTPCPSSASVEDHEMH